MASIVNIPFNFNPATGPTRKTTSYTVPAGKYAKAVLSFYAPRVNSFSVSYNQALTMPAPNWITVNGVNILVEKTHVIYLDWSFSYDSTCNLTFGAGFSAIALVGFYISALNNTNPTLNFNGISFNGLQIFKQGYTKAIGGDTLSIPSNGSGGTPRTGSTTTNIYLNNPSVPDQVEIWLKTGDVLSATGGNWQAVVTEYNNPS